MGVSISEYFGQRTDVLAPVIQPVTATSKNQKCPFMNKKCSKISRRLKPVCSVRKRNGDIWIVCRDRFCSTNKTIPLTDYQKNTLLAIAKEVNAETIETNAWRRQQEQFIIKGNIALQTGGAIVFCVGSQNNDIVGNR